MHDGNPGQICGPPVEYCSSVILKRWGGGGYLPPLAVGSSDALAALPAVVASGASLAWVCCMGVGVGAVLGAAGALAAALPCFRRSA